MSPPLGLGSVAWAVRRMDRPVSSVHLFDDIVLAGDWDGCLMAWDVEGNRLWSIDVGDRVGRIMTLDRGTIGCTSGLDVAEITMDGDLRWSTELEGTSDHLVEYGGGTLCATSAVWSIEHGDFMEGAVWCLDSEGQILHVERFDERPWDLLSSDAIVYLALAHPRSGLLYGDTDGMSHISLGESPATALQLLDETLFVGTSGGEIWSIDTTSPLANDVLEPIHDEETGVQFMTTHGTNLLIATETDVLVLDPDGEVCWRWSSPTTIEGMDVGFKMGSNPLVVVFHGRDAMATLTFLNAIDGEVFGHLSAESTIHCMHLTEDFLVLGLDSGEVYLLQGDLLSRRLSKDDISLETEAKAIEERSSMLARLRALRKDE